MSSFCCLFKTFFVFTSPKRDVVESSILAPRGRCKLQWLTFCVLMNFLQSVLYSNATKAL
jgi:hypothetical protein